MLLGDAGGEVTPVHGQVDPQGIVEIVQQLDELHFPEVRSRESVAGRHVGGGGGVGVVGVDVGQEGGHVGGHPGTQVLGGQTVEVGHGLVDGLDAVSQCELV